MLTVRVSGEPPVGLGTLPVEVIVHVYPSDARLPEYEAVPVTDPSETGNDKSASAVPSAASFDSASLSPASATEKARSLPWPSEALRLLEAVNSNIAATEI